MAKSKRKLKSESDDLRSILGTYKLILEAKNQELLFYEDRSKDMENASAVLFLIGLIIGIIICMFLKKIGM